MILIILGLLLFGYLGYGFSHAHRVGMTDDLRRGSWLWLWLSINWNLILLLITPIRYAMEISIRLLNWMKDQMIDIYAGTVDGLNCVTLYCAGRYYGKKFILAEMEKAQDEHPDLDVFVAKVKDEQE